MAEYARLATSYDQRWGTYVEATARHTLARLSLHQDQRLLDVGCGTGVLLGRLAAAYPTVVLAGVDPVPEMLAIARRQLPGSIELVAGWAEELPFGSGALDVVVTSNVFHYVADPHLALREMARVLRPGGRLVLTDWCDDYLVCRICSLYLRFLRRRPQTIYGTEACAGMLAQTGFVVEHIDRYKIDFVWGLMTAVAVRPADGAAIP